MSKQIVFFTFIFIFGSILSFMMGGEYSIVTSALASSIDADDTTITVASTSGFRSADNILVDNELIAYTALTATSFTGLTRGAGNSAPASHESGTRVYSETAGLLNQVVGFNILQTLADDGFFSWGGFQAVVSLPLMFLRAVAKITMWDFEFLSGHGSWVKYIFLYPLSAGLIVSFVSLIIRRGG